MKKLTLLCAGTLCACMLTAQPSFQTSLEAGISLPINSSGVNATHAGKAIHFGNHLDYLFGNGAVRFGLGAYIGYLNSISTDDKYKVTAEAIAEKYNFNPSQLVFNSSDFKSTHILLGPVASFGSGRCSINVWAKGGYGLNEPGRYSVVDKENGTVNNVYINQAGENKNGLAYNAGAGIKYALSDYVGLQLSAGYFSTQTDQVNYNFDREKGLAPLYYTASNQFVQASAGLQFTIGNPGKRNKTVNNNLGTAIGDTANPISTAVLKIKTKSNIKNDRLTNNSSNNTNDNPEVNTPGQAVLKIKTKSNIKNDRLVNNDNSTNDNPGNDSLFFSPEKIELRSQLPVQGNAPLQAIDNYLTGFVYQTSGGNVISQCGSNAMPGDPVPGIDVKLSRMGAAANELMTAKTNRDGSFSFNNITPGNYNAEAGTDKLDVTVTSNRANDFKILDISNDNSCSNSKENYIISAGDKTYVEIISATNESSTTSAARKHPANIKFSDISAVAPRDAATGMATGKRMHKPYRVANTDFDVNMNSIVTSDGKLYAEVIASRELSTGTGSGGPVLVTGDIDGDGIAENAVATTNSSNERKHVANIKWTPGMTVLPNETNTPANLRMHKPMVITKELDFTDDADEIVSPRDAASGLPAGKRMHKPMVITKELDLTDDADEIVSPRDAASGLPAGKRMHKPMVITKELGVTEDGDEVIIYTVIHRDLATRNILLGDEGVQQKMAIAEQGVPRNNGHKKGIITGKDNDTGMYTGGDDNAAEEDVVQNPLYQSGGSQGVNPLFEGKGSPRVIGGNGRAHDIFIPSNIVINAGSQAGALPLSSYDIMPVKWMAPESMASAKGIQEKGIKKNEAMAKGWDGTVKGGSVVTNISRINCTGGTCTLDATVEVDGKEYEAVISGIMKTKHDTVKNSISNIR